MGIRKNRISQICENLKQVRMIDMHAHLFCFSDEGKKKREGSKETAFAELEFRKNQGIFTCFSAGTPEEWEWMENWRKRKEILVSFGIHPWYADRYSIRECRENLEKCDFIGEIGMDSVWCQVPSDIQQSILEKQLQAAADLGKPIMLHTKGQEQKIGEIIKDFPGKICVHWYSGTEKDLELYLEKDCYFTLGPDVKDVCEGYGQMEEEKKKSYQRILKEVQTNRLFVETDGISSVAWAKGEETADRKEIPAVLEESMKFAAEVKGSLMEQMQNQIKENLMDFLK